MISYYTIIVILLCHWVYDFLLQTDDMSKNKSKCNIALLSHVLVYTIGLTLMGILNSDILGYKLSWFIIMNSVFHFLTDWVTSRATSTLYKEERYHDFFVVIGFDQMIHYITLFGTFIWLKDL